MLHDFITPFSPFINKSQKSACGSTEPKIVGTLKIVPTVLPLFSCYTGEVATQSAVSKNRLATIIWFDPNEGCPNIFARLLQKKGKAMTLAAGNRVRYELVPSAKLVETAAFILAKVI